MYSSLQKNIILLTYIYILSHEIDFGTISYHKMTYKKKRKIDSTVLVLLHRASYIKSAKQNMSDIIPEDLSDQYSRSIS